MNPKLKHLLNVEVDVMHKTNHPNLMHLYEFLESANNYYMVIQYCNGGDLEGYIHKQSAKLLNENEALYYLKQIMNGFSALYKEKIMHRDFKLANIFLHNDVVVIGDFGFAKSGFEMAQTKLGTPVTMAPELHTGQESYNNKADLWSIGVVFYEMLYGDNPFFGLSMPEILANIREKSGNNLPFLDSKNKVSNLSKDLLKRLLEMDPDRRIDWESFFNHPVFTEKRTYEGTKATVEKEFENNRKSVFVNMDQQTFIDPMKMNATAPHQVADTPSHQQRIVVDVEMLMKENQFRYLHEKNKIMLIFLTIKKLRKLMKDPDYYELARYLFLLVSVLAKKGTMLSELTIYSLERMHNIFKLNDFEAFCSNSRPYQEVSNYLKEDRDVIFRYFGFLTNIRNEVNLSPEDEGLLGWLQNKHIDLPQLDEKALFYYQKIQESPKPVKLSFNPEENRRFLLTMFLVLHSIRCEHLIPYINNGSKFEWETFKMKFESMNPDTIAKAIQIIGY